jgi:hypothetical protein
MFGYFPRWGRRLNRTSPRGAAFGVGDRQARRVVSALIGKGILISDSTRAPSSYIEISVLYGGS